MLNPLSFCLSVRFLISPSYLNEILAGYSNLGCRFFSFITLSMSCHSLWPEEFLLNNQLLWESPWILFVAFPLLLLIFSLYFNFFYLNYNMCWCGSLWIHLVWIHCTSWTKTFLLSQLKKVFRYCAFKHVLCPFLSVFSFWDLYNANISILDVVSEVS